MLSIVNVQKKFGARCVLQNVSAVFHAGAIHTLMGRNGSGKSTLLKIIAGEIVSDSGSILYENKTFRADSTEWKRVMAFVPDDDALIDDLSVYEHFTLQGSLSGLQRDELNARVQRLISIFDLDEAAAAERTAEISRGNKKRLACALAFLNEPRVILMDEPFAALDVEHAAVLIRALREVASKGRAVIFSSHDVSMMRQLADTCVVLENGTARQPMRIFPMPHQAAVPAKRSHGSTKTRRA